jgi:hypothetical protein
MSTPPKVPGPFDLLNEAIRKVPATKYALAVGGIIAVIAIVASFKINLWVATLGAVVMLVLMTVFVIFASLADQKKTLFAKPVLVFTWFSLLLIMLTALVVFSSAFWKWPMYLPLPLGDQRVIDLGDDIQKLVRTAPKEDAWKSYESDYKNLGRLTLRYLHYIEDDKSADGDSKVFSELKEASKTLRQRNENHTVDFPEGDPKLYHARDVPDMFDGLLARIGENKQMGLSPDWEPCYEAAVQRWFHDAGFTWANPADLSQDCRDYLHLQTNIP